VSAQPDASLLFRAGLLDGVAVLCAGERGPLGAEIERVCTHLGAEVRRWEAEADRTPADVLCYDGDATFAASAGEREALDACLERAWDVTREVVAAPLLEVHAAQDEAAHAVDGRVADADRPRRAHPSRIVFLAPRAGSGAFAEAASAGLENLARTLSIEWARYGVSAVAILPGATVAATEVAALVAYLASAAGGYFSGCLFDLTGPEPTRAPTRSSRRTFRR
jgi:NAD(P)-dependent dehydrogenase (short-subunit alcohol dehydrogenase family)